MQRFLIIISGFIMSLILVGCAPAIPTPLPARTIPVVQPSWTPIASATSAATARPTPAPSTPTAAPAAKDECVACHTSKDSLVKSAKPEEKKEAESEGVG